jgi:hypothetical protein
MQVRPRLDPFLVRLFSLFESCKEIIPPRIRQSFVDIDHAVFVVLHLVQCHGTKQAFMLLSSVTPHKVVGEDLALVRNHSIGKELFLTFGQTLEVKSM